VGGTKKTIEISFGKKRSRKGPATVPGKDNVYERGSIRLGRNDEKMGRKSCSNTAEQSGLRITTRWGGNSCVFYRIIGERGVG